MAGFNPADYVDVAERIREFKAKHPEGRLTGHGEFVRDGSDEIVGYIYTAYAHTSAEDDALPATGTAYEPIPGKTSFTKDSEVMNAETSAWGRAIVALGFPTKKIASADEVQNRQPSPGHSVKVKDAAPATSLSPPAGAATANGVGAITERLFDICEQLGVDRGKTRELIAKHPGDEEWLRRQLVTAEANLAAMKESDASPFKAPVKK